MMRSGREDFENLVKLVGNALDAFTTAFFLYDEPSGELSLFTHFSLSSSINSSVTFKPGQGVLGWVAKERKPIVVKEFSHDTGTMALYTKDEDIKSFAAVPVMEGDRLIGVLSIDSKRQYSFSPKNQKILHEFANTIARAATRFEQKRKFQDEAACVESLESLVSELASSAGIDGVVKTLYSGLGRVVEHSKLLFALKSPEKGLFYAIPEPKSGEEGIEKIPRKLDQSHIGWVIRKGIPLNHHDLTDRHNMEDFGDEADARKGYGSFLGVPMIVGRQVVGALGVFSREPNAFSQRDVRVLSIIGSIAASHVAGIYVSGKNISTQKLDPLTGLGTYNDLVEKIEKIDPTQGALLTLDICNFSRITNEFSVGTADAALIEIARFLKRIVGREGIVSRYYGDVFLIYLQGHNCDDAVTAARKLQEILKTKNFYIDSSQIVFECRIGIALYPDHGRNGSELIKRSFAAVKQSAAGSGAPGVAVYTEIARKRAV